MTDHLALFSRIRARHGHYCAMSTLGGRLGLAALRVLGEDASALTATYHIDTCAVDGIAVATGCVPEIKAGRRHQLELHSGDGHGVAAELTAAALRQAAACRVRLDRGEDPDEVLAGLRSCPAEELVVVTSLGAGAEDA